MTGTIQKKAELKTRQYNKNNNYKLIEKVMKDNKNLNIKNI